jgi:hypothetical protein
MDAPDVAAFADLMRQQHLDAVGEESWQQFADVRECLQANAEHAELKVLRFKDCQLPGFKVAAMARRKAGIKPLSVLRPR